MMKKLDKHNIKIKNLIGIIDNPTHEDLLYEIVEFLENEGRTDFIFNKGEVSIKTRCRIASDLVDDIEKLCELGYIEKLKYTQYRVLKHIWG